MGNILFRKHPTTRLKVHIKSKKKKLALSFTKAQKFHQISFKQMVQAVSQILFSSTKSQYGTISPSQTLFKVNLSSLTSANVTKMSHRMKDAQINTFSKHRNTDT